jgi:hypothetical protein
MNTAKIQLSPDELMLVQNGSWILTKNMIIQKVCTLFGSIAEEMKETSKNYSLPQAIGQTTPKISKGENYQGFPYVILDYPRLFSKENVFAIRTLFWWSNYFSITLHLKGIYKEEFSRSLLKSLPFLASNDFYISIAEDEWQHHIDESNYVLLKKANDAIRQKYFLHSAICKFSAKINLNEWNESEKLLTDLNRVIWQSLYS